MRHFISISFTFISHREAPKDLPVEESEWEVRGCQQGMVMQKMVTSGRKVFMLAAAARGRLGDKGDCGRYVIEVYPCWWHVCCFSEVKSHPMNARLNNC